MPATSDRVLFLAVANEASKQASKQTSYSSNLLQSASLDKRSYNSAMEPNPDVVFPVPPVTRDNSQSHLTLSSQQPVSKRQFISDRQLIGSQQKQAIKQTTKQATKQVRARPDVRMPQHETPWQGWSTC
jgi:hypothetical protein